MGEMYTRSDEGWQVVPTFHQGVGSTNVSPGVRIGESSGECHRNLKTPLRSCQFVYRTAGPKITGLVHN